MFSRLSRRPSITACSDRTDCLLTYLCFERSAIKCTLSLLERTLHGVQEIDRVGSSRVGQVAEFPMDLGSKTEPIRSLV